MARPRQAVPQQCDRVRPGVVQVELGHGHERASKGNINQKEGDRVTHGQDCREGG